jgi:hypothetical protein
MVLFMLSFSFIAVICLAPTLKVLELVIVRERQSNALSAASLAAAKDITRIVTNDPYFGFIALTDYPPIGRATKAADGEPLPVIGLNTIWATCREELLLAELLDDNNMRQFARRDMLEASRASKDLTNLVKRSLTDIEQNVPCDYDGKPVKAYVDAIDAYKANGGLIGGTDQIRLNKSINLELGWLNDEADSCVNYPQPSAMALLSPDKKLGDHYRACVNVPVKDDQFYFAAFSRQASLVDASKFSQPDGKRLCSVIKAEAVCQIGAGEDHSLLGFLNHIETRCVACAVPQALPDTSLPGILRVRFGNGLIPELPSLRAILASNELAMSDMPISNSQGGDYPIDPQACLSEANNENAKSVVTVVARALFDWLRTDHGRVRLDALQQAFERPFTTLTNEPSDSQNIVCLLFEFDRKGGVMISGEPLSPFSHNTISENQLYALSTNSVHLASGLLTVAVRDEVSLLGTINGGKHAGQPVPGDPINWCELPCFNGDQNAASSKGEGSLSRGLIVVGNASARGGEGGISIANSEFRRFDYSPLATQPRKTYYSAGLASELKFDLLEMQ